MDMLDTSLDVASQDKSSDPGEQDDQVNNYSQMEDSKHQMYTTDVSGDQGGLAGVSAGITIDPSTVQYQLRPDGAGAQITYRVVQVAADGSGEVVASPFSTGSQGIQAVIQTPFNGTNNGSQGVDTKLAAYFPSTGAGDAGQDNTTIAQTASSGQFYVMMSPSEVLHGGVQRNLAPRSNYGSKPDGSGRVGGRDERRRQTHNEVERRRRDKINNWILALAKIVPDCVTDQCKQGQVSNQSKGGILAKTVDYIEELRANSIRLTDSLKDMERLQVDNELLRNQYEELKNENAVLRAQLQQHGIIPASDVTGST